MSIFGDIGTVAAGGPVGAAWVFAKRFGPYIVGAMVIIGALLWLRHDRAVHVEIGKRSRDAEVAQLTSAIAAQNAAIERLRLVSATAIAATDDALERADSARKSQAALSARLKAAARARPAAPCVVADVNREGWSAVQ